MMTPACAKLIGALWARQRRALDNASPAALEAASAAKIKAQVGRM